MKKGGGGGLCTCILHVCTSLARVSTLFYIIVDINQQRCRGIRVKSLEAARKEKSAEYYKAKKTAAQKLAKAQASTPVEHGAELLASISYKTPKAE